MIQHQIGCTAVRRAANRNLEAPPPRLVRLADDPLRHGQLAGITEANAVRGDDLEQKPMASSAGQALRQVNVRHGPTGQYPTEARRSDPGSPREIPMRES